MKNTIDFNRTEIEFLRYALNEAMDYCKNPNRYKIYRNLLEKLS